METDNFKLYNLAHSHLCMAGSGTDGCSTGDSNTDVSAKDIQLYNDHMAVVERKIIARLSFEVRGRIQTQQRVGMEQKYYSTSILFIVISVCPWRHGSFCYSVEFQ